tara:strand:+ start:384 stop:809 length:426 start_codon:yes stop_codon:yes gene_type:complete
MKSIKIIFLSILLVLGSSTFAQGLKLKMPTPSLECKSFNWENGAGVPVEIEFQYYVSAKSSQAVDLTKKQLENVVINTLARSKNSCKNKLSYIPKQMLIISGDNAGYNVVISMWSSSADGIKGERKAFFVLDADGNITSQF